MGVYDNDKKAPRMRKGEFSKIVITKDLYKKFIKEFPEYKGLSWKLFSDSWSQIAERVRWHAVNNPLGVKLGSYIGEIKVQYIPYKMDIPSKYKSQLAGEKVFEHNFDSKGKPARVKWERRWSSKFNKSLQFYGFNETRELTLEAGKYIVKNPNMVRVARITIGGASVWRKNDKK